MKEKKLLLANATIVNEGDIFKGSIFIEGDSIKKIIKNGTVLNFPDTEVIDLSGKYILPGAIDDQVHFREPGLEHKGTIESESKAAVAGGITSFMEMPNTKPQTITIEALDEKFSIAEKTAYANYSFYLGATNDNISELLKLDARKTCGVKVFMGSSTGNMLVDNPETLQNIFSQVSIPIAVHCEDEGTIQKNIKEYRDKFGEDIPIEAHPEIRSEEACYLSSSLAVELAKKFNAKLHVLHLSTKKETDLFSNTIPLENKRITGEVCIHHMWFNKDDYKTKGARIRWNPAVKNESDRLALIDAIKNDTLDIIATDHAPHTVEEKDGKYFNAMSGGPLVQHALVAMLELYHKGIISLEKIVDKMAHAPATLFEISKRGYIREGYFADLAIVDLNSPWTVDKSNILYKCGWSPFEGDTFQSKVTDTILNGEFVYKNGMLTGLKNAKALEFNR